MRTSRASTVGAGITFLVAVGLAAVAFTTGLDGTDTTVATTAAAPTAEAVTAQPTAPSSGGGASCGRMTPSGWPSTTMPDRGIGACLLRNFDAGTLATVTEVLFGTGPEDRHTVTYVVIGKRLIEKTTDWRMATSGPVGTVTVKHCTQMDTSSVPFALSDCNPV